MIISENSKQLLSVRLAELAMKLVKRPEAVELSELARKAMALEHAADALQREVYALRTGEPAPKSDAITTSWWALADRAKRYKDQLRRLVLEVGHRIPPSFGLEEWDKLRGECMKQADH